LGGGLLGMRLLLLLAPLLALLRVLTMRLVGLQAVARLSVVLGRVGLLRLPCGRVP